MNLIYLSDNIIINNEKVYFINNNNKHIIINKNNWHIFLSKLGWNKLCKRYISQLNKLTKSPNKNSLYGLLDCGGDGDCLFNCIEYAYNNNLETNDIITSCELRKLISDSIDNRKFEDIINYYKIIYDYEYNLNEDNLHFNPHNTNITQFKEIIKTKNFWGDYILTNELINILHINIIILYDNNGYLSKYNTLHNYDKYRPSIIIYYMNNDHFMLVGYFEDRMKSWFTDKEISNELRIILNIN